MPYKRRLLTGQALSSFCSSVIYSTQLQSTTCLLCELTSILASGHGSKQEVWASNGAILLTVVFPMVLIKTKKSSLLYRAFSQPHPHQPELLVCLVQTTNKTYTKCRLLHLWASLHHTIFYKALEKDLKDDSPTL